LNVTGNAGLTMDLSGETGLTNIVMGNSGVNSITINGASQGYVGSTGNDTLTLTNNPTKAIVGNGGTDTILLNANSTAFTVAGLLNVTGFSTLRTGAASQGTYNLSQLPSTINSIITTTLAGPTLFTNIVAGTPISFTATNAARNFTYQTADFNGPSNSLTITVSGSTASASTGGATLGYAFANELNLQDSITQGLGNLTVNGTANVNGAVNFVTTAINDPSLTSLTITGTAALRIPTLQGTSAGGNMTSNNLTIVDNDTSTFTPTSVAGVQSIGNIITNVLTNINYSGAKAFTIGTITGDNVSGLSITNANTGSSGVLTIGGTATVTNTSLTTLRLNGSVAISITDTNVAPATVLASTDHQTITFLHSAATVLGLGTTGLLGDTITVGNGGTGISAATTNQIITTGAAADTITTGSGVNNITAGLGADTVTFASHGGVDTINLATGSSVLAALTATNALDSGYFNGGAAVLANPSLQTPAGFTSNSVSTSLFDVYTGLRAGDVIDLTTAGSYVNAAAGVRGVSAATGSLVAAAIQFTNLTSITTAMLTTGGDASSFDNGIELVRGVYNSVTQTFNGSSTGTDSLLIYDANATVLFQVTEAIVLVGYVAGTLTTMGGTGGVITLG